MPTIHLETTIESKIDICFNLSRSIDLHKISTSHTNEEAIAGKTSGLIELNETVTWRAKHLGVNQTLTSVITQLDFPYFFVDEMQKGIFKAFRHEHHFKEVNGITTMVDVFIYQSPFGILGKLADFLFLKKYLTGFLIRRNLMIKLYAESNQWKEIL